MKNFVFEQNKQKIFTSYLQCAGQKGQSGQKGQFSGVPNQQKFFGVFSKKLLAFPFPRVASARPLTINLILCVYR
jgi:hypothetical protein